MSRSASTFLTAEHAEHFQSQDWWNFAPAQLKDKARVAQAAGVDVWTNALPIPEEMFSAALPAFFLKIISIDNMKSQEWHQGLRASVIRRILRRSAQSCAKSIGVSQSAISQHENGKRRISEKNQVLLAKEVGVSPGYLISGVHLDPQEMERIKREYNITLLNEWAGEDIPQYERKTLLDHIMPTTFVPINWIVPKIEPIDCPQQLRPWYDYMRNVTARILRSKG